jgi:Ca2+-transporting ATPase
MVHRQRVEDVLAALGSDSQHGLTEDDARSRLVQYGANELLSAPAIPAWRRFVRQFEDVLVILLLIATLISVGLWAFERDAALP